MNKENINENISKQKQIKKKELIKKKIKIIKNKHDFNKNAKNFLKKIDKLSDKELIAVSSIVLSNLKKNQIKTISGSDGEKFSEFKKKDIEILTHGIGLFNRRSIITKIYIILNLLVSFLYFFYYIYSKYVLNPNVLLQLILNNVIGFILPRWYFSFNIKNIVSYNLFLERYLVINKNSILITLLSNFINTSLFSLLYNNYYIYYYGGLLEYKISTEKLKLFKYMPNAYLYPCFFISILLGNGFMQHFFNKYIVTGINQYGNSLITVGLLVSYVLLFPLESILENEKKEQTNMFESKFERFTREYSNFSNKIMSNFFKSMNLLNYFLIRFILPTFIINGIQYLLPILYIKERSSIIFGLCSLHLFCFPIIFLLTYFFFTNIIKSNLKQENYYITFINVYYIKKILLSILVMIILILISLGIVALFNINVIGLLKELYSKMTIRWLYIKIKEIIILLIRVLKIFFFVKFFHNLIQLVSTQ